jgi:probable HAF family extracellular repeat protein
VVTDLGTLGGPVSYASAISDTGVIVGTSQIDNTGANYAFVYQFGTMYDLNAVGAAPGGWTLSQALSVSKHGVITGQAHDTNHNYAAFLSVPVLNLYVSNGFGVAVANPVTGSSVVLASGLSETAGMAFDAAGDVYVASGDPSSGIGSVIEITPAGTTSTYATGLGIVPSGLAFDSKGNLFVSSNTGAGNGNGVIYKVTPAGVVSTFATGLQYAFSMAIDDADNLYVCDLDTSTEVRKISPAGAVSNFVNFPNGAAGLAFDSKGTIVTHGVGGKAPTERPLRAAT